MSGPKLAEPPRKFTAFEAEVWSNVFMARLLDRDAPISPEVMAEVQRIKQTSGSGLPLAYLAKATDAAGLANAAVELIRVFHPGVEETDLPAPTDLETALANAIAKDSIVGQVLGGHGETQA